MRHDTEVVVDDLVDEDRPGGLDRHLGAVVRDPLVECGGGGSGARDPEEERAADREEECESPAHAHAGAEAIGGRQPPTGPVVA